MQLPDWINRNKFELYFACKQTDLLDYINSLGGNVLMSQYGDRKIICDYSERKIGSLLVDSGAYSAYTKGVNIDIDDYIKFINNNYKNIDYFVSLDCIPGRYGEIKTSQQLKDAPIISWNNYIYILDRIKCPEKLIPVYHQGEDIKYLKYMLDFKYDGHYIDYIGISPALDESQTIIPFLDISFKTILSSSNYNVKTHAFGLTMLELLEKYPYYSADSTTFVRAAGFGEICTPYGRIIISERKRHSSKHLNNYSRDVTDKLSKYVSERGYSLDELSKNQVLRAKFNIDYFYKWSQNYKFNTSLYFKKSLF